MRTLRSLTALLLVSAISCSGDTNEVKAEPAAEVIHKTGRYDLASVSHVFSLQKIEGNLVRAELLDKNGAQVSRATDGSIVHRYFFYWDKKNQRLWYNSSDVGIFLWVFEEKQPKLVSLDPDNSKEYVPLMPIAFYEALPSSLQRLWEKHR